MLAAMSPNRNLFLANLILGVASAGTVNAQCALPYTLTNGTAPDATKVMANFNALLSCFNAGGANNAIQYKTGTGALAGAGPLADGQLVIGATGSPPQAQNLTAGPGVTIVNGPGTVRLAATSGTASAGMYRQVMSSLPTWAGTGLAGWINQGAATATEGPAGITITGPSSAGDSLIVRYGPAVAPPYKLTVLLAVTRNSTPYSEAGIGWYDGISKFHTMQLVTPNPAFESVLQVQRWNAYNFRAGYDGFGNNAYYSQPIWFQLKDDGTNITFAFSQDGANFATVFTSAKSTAFLGPNGYNNFILFVNPRGTQTIITAMSWKVE